MRFSILRREMPFSAKEYAETWDSIQAATSTDEIDEIEAVLERRKIKARDLWEQCELKRMAITGG